MPSISPAALTYTGGTLRTSRLVPARLRYTGGTFTRASDTPVTTAAEIPKLDRLRRFDTLMKGESIDPRFQLIWQRTMEAIEDAFAAVNARVDEVALYARLNAVEALASAANDNAVAAQETAANVSVAVESTFTEIDPSYGSKFTEEINKL